MVLSKETERSGRPPQLEWSLTREIEAISTRGSLSSQPVGYFHTNDKNLETVVEKSIALAAGETTPLEQPLVGLVVGTGGLLSLLPYLPISLWLVCDRNKLVLDWVKRNIHALHQAPTFEQYIDRVYSLENGVLHDFVHSALKEEQKSLGKYHFTFNESAFHLTKKSLAEKRVVFCYGNLANFEFVNRIEEVLSRRRLDISFANLTNIYEHSPNVQDTLPTLPFRREAVIMWSRVTEEHNLDSGITVGIESYLRLAHKAYFEYKARCSAQLQKYCNYQESRQEGEHKK